MSSKNSAPIGIFDSGIGGLTVAREVIQQLPYEDIVYFGDTARVPYGNKSPQTVIRFSIENVKFLLKFKVKLIIVACNTSSSLALPALKKKFKGPILDVIQPAVKRAVCISSNGRIGIIGTRATVSSNCYQRKIKKINPQAKPFAQACPLFVPLAEEGWTNDEIARKVARRYLQPLLAKDIDTLILGCTHYPLLRSVIRKVAGARLEFIDSARELALQAKMILAENGMHAKSNSALGRARFYVSDEPARFREIGRKFLRKTIQTVHAVRGL